MMAYGLKEKGDPAANTADSVSESEQDGKGSPVAPQVGELKLGEAEAGGLGRHLGVFSTTLLM